MRLVSGLSLLLALAALGCATAPIRSHSVADKQRGIPYSLPATAVHVTLTVAPTAKKEHTVTLAAVAQPIPDPRYQYVLEHSPHLLFSDDLTLSVDSNGLVSSAIVNTTDKTPAVFEGLISIAASAAEITAGGFGTAFGGGKSVTEALRALEGTHEFLVPLKEGPTPLDISWAGTQLTLELHVKRLGSRQGVRAPNASPGGGNKGVYVRMPEPYSVTTKLFFIGAKRYLVSSAGVLNAPDFSPIVTIPIERASLVAAQNNLTFEGGLLTSAHYVRPSPADSAVTSVSNAVGSVVDLPTKLIQARFNVDTEAAKLLELQQKAEDDARARQEAERTRLRALADDAFEAQYSAERAWLDWDAARSRAPNGAETRRLRHVMELARRRANQLARDAGQRRPYPSPRIE